MTTLPVCYINYNLYLKEKKRGTTAIPTTRSVNTKTDIGEDLLNSKHNDDYQSQKYTHLCTDCILILIIN